MTGLIRGHQDRDYGEIPGPPTSLNKTRRCCAPRLPGDFSASNDLFAPAAPSPTPLDVSTKQQFKVTKTSSSFVRFCLSHQNELPVLRSGRPRYVPGCLYIFRNHFEVVVLRIGAAEFGAHIGWNQHGFPSFVFPSHSMLITLIQTSSK